MEQVPAIAKSQTLVAQSGGAYVLSGPEKAAVILALSRWP